MTADPARHTNRIGTWGGPGVLLLIDGVWNHYDRHDLRPELLARARGVVGTDAPRILIKTVPDSLDAVAP